MLVPEYNQTLNKLAVWLIALNPVAKYGLTLNPVILSCQLGLTSSASVDKWLSKSSWRRVAVQSTGIVLISSIVVLLSVMLPDFDQIMSLLGALFSFTISGIFPIVCDLKLFRKTLSGWQVFFDYTILVVATFMAVTGTIRSLM